MPKLSAFLIDLRELGFPLLERAMVAAPRENPVRPRDGMSGEGADDDQGKRGRGRAAYQTEALGSSTHPAFERITKESDAQVKRMIWWAKRG